jgi:PHD/YefM family antitoxin component YafN of YafNO toxin-antitoxin module
LTDEAAVEATMTEPMKTVSAKEVASKFGYYTDEAMLHPVGIQRHGTTRVVMLSLKEYERLLRRDRQVLLVKDLEDETLEAIRNAKTPDEARRLDHLMDDPEAG